MRSSARENLLDPVQLLARPAITLSAKPPLDLGHQLPLQNVPEGLRCLPVVPLFLALACSFVAFGRKIVPRDCVEDQMELHRISCYEPEAKPISCITLRNGNALRGANMPELL